MSSYTYDSPTRTLTITGPAGYAEVMSSDLTLDEIHILKDRSQPDTDDEQKTQPIADDATIRADRTFQSYSPPADFPLLPNLREAHFTGVLLQPPRFPLPPGCKLYVYLRARLRQKWPIYEMEHISYYYPVDPLDEVFPWFEMPGLAVLQLRDFKHSTGPPPPCDSLEHLFLWDSHCFVLPEGSKLSENLKTFVLQYSNHDYDDTDETLNTTELFAALPSHSLQTLVVNRMVSESFIDDDDEHCDSLAHFTKLATLCVWPVLFEENERLIDILPGNLETLVLQLQDWRPYEDKEITRDIKDYCQAYISDNLRKLVIFKDNYREEDPEGDEDIRNLCRELGIDLTLAGSESYSSRLDPVIFPEELEAGCVYPHVQVEPSDSCPFIQHSLRFKKYPA